MRFLPVDVGVVCVWRLEGGGRVCDEVVKERRLLTPEYVACERAKVSLLKDAQRSQLGAAHLFGKDWVVDAAGK